MNRVNWVIYFLITWVIVLPCDLLVAQSSSKEPGKSDVVSSLRSTAEGPIDIGSRLELFIDDYLIDTLKGKAELRLHHPEPKEIVISHDEPWEGPGSGYHSIFKDGDLYRMYYKSWHMDLDAEDPVPIFGAYAESKDGIHWTKPNLGLYEFQGSKDNNIVFIRGIMDGVEADGAHLAVFKDENPNVKPDARYKAFLTKVTKSSKDSRGLFPFKSADGIHWKAMSEAPVITDGAFDSQNLAFWDSVNEEYRAYWRYKAGGEVWEGLRSIRTATSKDFKNWSEQADLQYVDSPQEHLYTSVIKPYYRAPHLYIGFPTRYIERGWSDSMEELPEPEHRKWRSGKNDRYGMALTESLLMVSRDGVNFKRWNEAFLRPGIERTGTWNYGHQYLAWSVVETESALEGAPNELSFYAIENYWTGNSCDLRRYTLRIDGFVSVNAPMRGGELITKPLIFTGSNLVLNFASSAAGDVLVEIQDESGNPIPGFTFEDCAPIFGDSLERTVKWKNASDLSSLNGKPIRLHFKIKDADLYSLRFK